MPDHVCPQCGKTRPEGAPAGMCPHCLLSLGVQARPAEPAAASTKPGDEGITVIGPAEPGAPTHAHGTAPGEQPGQRIGRYKLLEPIGEGGFGTVWMAEQTEPVRRKVALKIIKLGMDTKEVVARFEAERQALAMMDHPNIARVFDGGATDAGRPYFVMELVRGVRITEYCDAVRLSTEERLKLFIEVCQAVQHAHQKGVIHRDLKPSNVIVTEQDGRPVPKVIDFGIAKATGAELTDKTFFTRFNQVIGTPAYMSPEQAGLGGLDIDTRSDVYSLGVLLYELLTGRTPFSNEELRQAGFDAVLRLIREKDPPKPSTRLSTLAKEELLNIAARRRAEPQKFNRQVRGELDWIVMKALEKDRSRRYESASVLAQEIACHLSGEPVAACPPGTWYRVKKFARRHRLAVASTAAVATALGLGIVVSTWQAMRATRSEREQSRLRQRADDQRRVAEEAGEQARIGEYQAKMLAAQAGWDDNNLALLDQVLKQTQGHEARGIEWRHWQRLCHLELRALYGHRGPIHAAVFSPEGSRIATGGEDATLRLWNTATGHEMLTLLGHSGAVLSVRFSPDGLRLASGGKDGTVRVWDLLTGMELWTFRGTADVVRSVDYSPDGRFIAAGNWRRQGAGSPNRFVTIWDLETGHERQCLDEKALASEAGFSVPQGPPGAVFSPDGRQILLSPFRVAVPSLWDARTGHHHLTVDRLKMVGYGVLYHAVFSPDGQWIATGGDTVPIWNADTGRHWQNLVGHRGSVNSIAFSPDSRMAVTGSSDGTAKCWKTATGRELLTLNGHKGPVTAAAFSPDDQLILTASTDGTARVWDAKGPQGWRPMGGPPREHPVTRVALSPDAGRLATADRDSTARIWDASTGHELAVLRGHSHGISAIAFSSDGRRVLTGSNDKSARMWDASTGRELFALQGHTGAVTSVAFSSDDQRLLTAGQDRTARVWGAANGRELLCLRGHDGAIHAAAFSTRAHALLTGASDGVAILWDAATGRELLRLRANADAVRSVAFSPDDRRMAIAGNDGIARIWDVRPGPPSFDLRGHHAPVVSIAFSSDGRRLVTASEDGTVRLWDPVTGNALITLPRLGNFDSMEETRSWPSILPLAIAPDFRRIAVIWKGSAYLWDAASDDDLALWRRAE